MTRLAIASLAALSLASPAAAESVAHKCGAYATVKENADNRGETIVELTGPQRDFMAGVAAMDPGSPPGLPYGDKAVWIRSRDGSALIFFVDGDKACDVIDAPKLLVEMVLSIGNGDVLHPHVERGDPL